jgi:hypothetical protein
MQYIWNGSDGSYTDASNWTPQEVPLYGGGASAVIQSGTVTLSNVKPNDVLIALAGPTEANQPNLVLDNAALGPGVYLTLVTSANSLPGQAPAVGFATITVNGYDTNEGRISLGGGKTAPDFLRVAIAPYSQLNQEGTISVFDSSQLRVSGTDPALATLNNDGTIEIVGGSAVISTDIIGSGTIAFLTAAPGFSESVELGGAVSATQHVSFSDPNISRTVEGLRIDNPSAFHGIIDGFNNPIESVTLANTQADMAYFAQITPDAGALLLLDGQQVVGALTVTGQHASNAYGVSSNPDGSTTVSPVFLPFSS